MLFQFVLFKFLHFLLALKLDYTVLLLLFFFFFLSLLFYLFVVSWRWEDYILAKKKAIDVLRKMEIIFPRNLTFR